MSTDIRPEVSKKNEYWLERHRYYELKHFCLQYPIWKKACDSLDGLSKKPEDLALFNKGNDCSDPTARCAEAREYYQRRVHLVEHTAMLADEDLAVYILKGVTEGLSYDKLNARYSVPCCKDAYYQAYRRFFWLLNKERD